MTVPNLPTSTTASPSTLVHVGTVVHFAFPYTEKRRRKIRPCLIVALDHARQEVVEAYGTTRLYGPESSAHALRFVEPHEFQLAGLDEATRFQLDRRIRVPLTSSRFRVGPAGEPLVLGRISPRAAQRAADLTQHCLTSVSRRRPRACIRARPRNSAVPGFIGAATVERPPDIPAEAVDLRDRAIGRGSAGRS